MSGWRAGLVALALGSMVLAAGWFFTRDTGPSDPGSSTTIPVDADVTLACPSAYQLACDGLASRLGAARATYRPGTEIGEGTLVIAAVGDYPEGVTATPFARSPIAIAIWQERSPALQRGCAIDISCLIDQAGVSWSDLGGPASWGTVALGLADPTEGIADLEAWRLFVEAGVAQSPGFGSNVRLRAPDEGQLTSDLILFPSRADAVVTSEVAIASQLENARQRAGRLAVFYPDPTPFVVVGVYGEGRAARNLAEELSGEELQALLGSLGLRPLAGEAVDLPEGLGSPGGELAAVDPAQRETLVASWQEVVGG
ncbi:MAG TPA: hypothetical protein VJR05_04195 [Acidimicrobiia bacterium]|nr:hypothetical protein [Acidimicrobiia bacterium]